MTIRIEIDGVEIRPPLEYTIELDMLEPADAFTMTQPLDRKTVNLAALDAPFQILNDDVPIMTGWLDEAEETDDGRLVLRGMDKVGRLVAESLPGAGMLLGNVLVDGAIQRLIAPWFDAVEFSNASNRRLTRGRGRKSRAGREPALSAAQRRQIPRRLEAGMKRWEGLMAILEPLRLLAWSRGDGAALVVASPQYSQAPQWEFFEEFDRSNVLSISRRRSIGDRYSQIEVSGSGRPPGVPAPPFFPSFPGQRRPKHVNRTRIGVADDSTGDFRRQKRLFVVSEAMSQAEAQELAERMLGQGLVNAEQIMVTVAGHGQARPGTSIETLYTFDTTARVRRAIEAAPGDDSPRALIDEDYLVTRVELASTRAQGETTRLTMGPTGAALT